MRAFAFAHSFVRSRATRTRGRAMRTTRVFDDDASIDRARRAMPTTSARYPFVGRDDEGKTRHRETRGATTRAKRRDGATTRGKRATTREGSANAGERTVGARVRVEDVLESTRAAEEALKRDARDARDARDGRDGTRERAGWEGARDGAGGAVRMLAREGGENARLSEENARLGEESRARGTGTPATRDEEEEEEEALDETVKELFDLVESERRARRALEEKLSEYERGAGEERDEDATRRAEEAEETVREQEKKLSQAADIIGELRTTLLQVMETENRGGAPESVTTNSQVDGEERRDGGTPLERTTAAVKVWEGKVEKLVLETVKSALERAMDSPALQTNKREGEQVVSSVTDAINHELSAIVENAMSGIVDEMRFQFGQEDEDEEEMGSVGGRKRFIVWLADENMRRAQLEEQLTNVQDELARSEASRQIATQRWLQAMNQIDGSAFDDESDLGEILSRVDDMSDDGTSVYSLEPGDLGSPRRRRPAANRRAMSVVGEAPMRSDARRRATKSETHEHVNLHDVSIGPHGRLETFKEEEDDPIVDLAIEATPGGSVYFALRAAARNVLVPCVTRAAVVIYRIAQHIHALCVYCASSPNFELIWPVVLLLAAFYWKIGAFDGAVVASPAVAVVAERTARARVAAPPAVAHHPPSIRIVD